MESMTQTGGAMTVRGEGRALSVLGEQIVCKLDGERGAGAWSLFEVTTGPGSGPPPHRHDGWVEAHYILEGEIEFMVDGRALTARPGDFVLITKGTVHGYTNKTSVPVRYLLWAVPGGVEDFFEELDREIKPENVDLPKILGIAARYGIQAALPPEV